MFTEVHLQKVVSEKNNSGRINWALENEAQEMRQYKNRLPSRPISSALGTRKTATAPGGIINYISSR